VIGTLGFDGWAVTFGTARKELGGAASTNGQCRPSNSVLFHVIIIIIIIIIIIVIIIIIINEKINVAFSRRTARTRNSYKNKNRENVMSNSTEEKK